VIGRVAEGHPLVAALYDPLMRVQDAFGFRSQRIRTARSASGRVLEVGVGTGLNLAYYEAADDVVGIEPDPHMLRRARARADEAPCPVRLLEASAESLPFGDDEFDTVVFALSLCTIPDPRAALAESRRVLVTEGRLVFLEHVRAERHWAAAVQDRIAPAWRRVAGGCNLNRDTVSAISEQFEIERLWRKGVIVQGEARPRA
jgi:ubiquinone/menaquinone biosynthesis C-methylase UbiE